MKAKENQNKYRETRRNNQKIIHYFKHLEINKTPNNYEGKLEAAKVDM